MSMNCFVNDMLVTLVKPLSLYYKIPSFKFRQNYLDISNLKIEIPNDKRFKIFKNKKKLLNLSHSDQIKLMIINNSAHKLYLSNKLKYNDIVKYIMSELKNNSKKSNLNTFKQILDFISINNQRYQTNV